MVLKIMAIINNFYTFKTYVIVKCDGCAYDVDVDVDVKISG